MSLAECAPAEPADWAALSKKERAWPAFNPATERCGRHWAYRCGLCVAVLIQTKKERA